MDNTLISIKPHLKTLLAKNSALETHINPQQASFGPVINKLTDLSTHLVDVKEQAMLLDDGADKESILELITAAKRCNMQRIKILAKIDGKKQDKITYSYHTYRQDIEELKQRISERQEQAQRLFAADDEAVESKNQHDAAAKLSDDMDTEDGLLIKLLVATSTVDGSVHRKEQRQIIESYQNITKQKPDKDRIKQSIAYAQSHPETVLDELRDNAQDIFPHVRTIMFSAAVEVALADHKLYKEERQLLIEIMDILEIDQPEVAQRLQK